MVAAQRVRQPVHEDRVGVTVHADNLKGADDVVVQLASVRVMGVHKDPIPDLEGLVDRPHTLVEVPLVPTLGRGEGGSDLLMRFRKWSRCCSLASRAVLGVVCGYGSLGRRSRANVHTRSGTMNSSGATPVLCCGREFKATVRTETSSSHVSWWSSTYALSWATMVRLYRSTCPFVCGW